MRLVLVALVLVGCRGDQNATPPPADKWVEVKPPPTDEAGRIEADLDRLIRAVAPFEEDPTLARETAGKLQRALGDARAARTSHDVDRMKQAKAALEPIAGEVAAAHVPAPPSPVARKLYGADVATDALPLTISIETIGGVATPVLPRGTKLPAHFSEMFSTGADDQPSVEVHLVQGERPLLADNHEIGKFQLTGIPPAPRGVPQIMVDITVDTHGLLDVSATDKATGRTRSVAMTSAGGPALGQAAIDQALAEATAHRAADDRTRRTLDLEVKLDSLLYAERKLERDVGAKVGAPLAARWRDAMATAEIVRAGGHDLDKLQHAFDTLQKASHDVATYLYDHAP